MIPSGVSHVRRALAVLALLASGVAFANPEPWQLNLTPGVTSISQRIWHLHMLTIIWLRCAKGHFTKDHHFAFEAVAWYWHFVDVVWLGLFLFVYVL